MTVPFQPAGQGLPHNEFIVDDQNFGTAHEDLLRTRGFQILILRGALISKVVPSAELRAHIDGAPVFLDDAVNH
jgi:hypothetical protein